MERAEPVEARIPRASDGEIMRMRVSRVLRSYTLNFTMPVDTSGTAAAQQNNGASIQVSEWLDSITFLAHAGDAITNGMQLAWALEPIAWNLVGGVYAPVNAVIMSAGDAPFTLQIPLTRPRIYCAGYVQTGLIATAFPVSCAVLGTQLRAEPEWQAVE